VSFGEDGRRLASGFVSGNWGMAADDQSTEMPNPYEPPKCMTRARRKVPSVSQGSTRTSLKSVLLLILIGVAWIVGTDAGRRAWSAVYPPKDPAPEMFWAHCLGLALGIALYAVFDKRVQRPGFSAWIAAVLLAVAIGLGSSLAGVNLAIWLRAR
jgi:hypothetical protein